MKSAPYVITNPHKMNLRQLETFRAVMIAGSTQAAARMLHVSQPAVSRMLAHTESALGVALFERRKGRLIPTADARMLHREIEPLFLAVEAAESRIRDIREGRTGSIRIVSTPSMASTLVAQGLHRLRRRAPDISITLDVRRWETLATQLEANNADVGFVLTSGDRPEVETQPLSTGRMVCILPRAHPLAERETIGPADLAGVPFVRLARSSPLGDLTTRALGPAAHGLKTVVETRYCHSVCSLVQSGIGIGLVDQFVAATGDFPGLAVRPFEPAIPVTVYVVLSRNRPPSRLVLRLIHEIQALLADPPPPISPRQA